MGNHALTLTLPTAPVASSTETIKKDLLSIAPVADKVQKKLDAIGGRGSSGTKKLGESASKASPKVRQLGDSAGKTSPKVKKLGESAGVAAGKTDRLRDSSDKFSATGEKTGGVLDSIGKKARDMAAGLVLAATAFFGIGAGISELGEGVRAAITLESVSNALEVATGSALAGADALAFVRSEADRLGLSIGPTASEFSKLSAAAIGTSLAGAGVRDIFSAVSEAGARLSLSSEQQAGALKALGQIMSKGTVQAEELRGQLGERIPGAFQIMARGLDVTTKELGKMLEMGQVLAEDALPAFAREMRKTFGTDVTTRIDTAAAGLARFQTALFDARVVLGEAFLPALGDVTKQIAAMLAGNESMIRSFGTLSGDVLGELVRVLGFVVGNLDFFLVALTSLAVYQATTALSSTNGLTAAVARLNAALLANPFGLALTAVVALGLGLNVLVNRHLKASEKAIEQMVERSDDLRKSFEKTSKVLKSGSLGGLAADLSRAEKQTRSLTDEIGKLRRQEEETIKRTDELYGTAGSFDRVEKLIDKQEMLRERIDGVNQSLQVSIRQTQLLREADEQAFQAALLAFNPPAFKSWVDEVEKGVDEITDLSEAIQGVNDELSALRLTASIMREFKVSAEDAGDAAELVLASGMELSTQRALELVEALRLAGIELEAIASAQSAAAAAAILASVGQAPGQLASRDFDPFASLDRTGSPAEQEFARMQLFQEIVAKQMKADVEARHDAEEEFNDGIRSAAESREKAERAMIDSFPKIINGLERVGLDLDDVAFGLFEIGHMLARSGNGLAGAVVNAAGVFAAGGSTGDVATSLLVGAAGASQIGQQQVSQFGGLTEGNFFVEGVTLGAEIGGIWGAIIGGFVGSFINKGADDLEGSLTEIAGAADFVITLADENLADLGRQIEEALETSLNQLQSQLIADLDFEAAGVSIDIRGNEFVVIAGGIRKTFNDVDQAMAFIVGAVLRMNSGAEGLGEQMRQLALNATSFEGMSLEDLQRGIALAQQLDFERTGVNQALIRSEMDLIQTSIRFGLSLEQTTALIRKRADAEKQALSASAAAVLGAQDFTTGILNLTRSMEVFNNTNDAANAATERRKVELLSLITAQDEHTAALQTAEAEITGSAEDQARFAHLFSSAGQEYVVTQEDATNAVKDSTHQTALWQKELDALNAGFLDRPENFGQDEFAALWIQAVKKAELSLIDLIQVVEGEGAFSEERANAQKLIFAAQLHATIAQSEIVLATMEFVSDTMRESFERIVQGGRDALEKVLGEGFEFPAARGGGGRGRARREEQARAVDSFDAAMESLERRFLGLPPAVFENADAMLELEQQAIAAGASTEETARALAMLAEVQIAEVVDPIVEAAERLRQADVKTEFLAIIAASEEALVIVGDNAAARLAIENATAAELRELGISSLGGRVALRQGTLEAVRGIKFLVENMEDLGLSASQIANSVRDQVLPELFGILKSEAQRVIDLTVAGSKEREVAEAALATAIQNEIALERTLTIIKLEGLRLQLLAANALTPAFQAMFDTANELLNITTVPISPLAPEGETDEQRQFRLSKARARALQAADTAAQGGDAQTFLEDIINSLRADAFNDFERAAAQFQQTMDDISVATGTAAERADAIALAEDRLADRRADILDDLLSPFEESRISTVQDRLREVNATFDDIISQTTFTAQELERIEAARGTALLEATNEIFDPLREVFAELRATDPRRSGQELFQTAQSRFQDLAERARAGDLEAIAALPAAIRDLQAQSAAFLGQGGASLAVRDNILALESALGLDASELSDPVVAAVDKSNVFLEEIAAVLTGRPPTGSTRPVGGDGGTISEFLTNGRPIVVVNNGGGLDASDPAVRRILQALLEMKKKEQEERENDRQGQANVDVDQSEQRAAIVAAVDRGSEATNLLATAVERNQPAAGDL